jgi:hypothetical protein
MLNLSQMMQAAARRWPGLRERAGKVTIQGAKSGFRDGWKVPDVAYWDNPGVQEIMFVTIASDSGTDNRFKKPYRTIFRFPLDPSTGAPYASFRYYSEVALTGRDNSDVIESDGSYPRINNPQMDPYICKHLFATAEAAVEKRKTLGVTASAHTRQKEPRRLEPKGRQAVDPGAAKGPRTSKEAVTLARPSTIPQTWLGRLAYILFGEKGGR